MIAQNAKNAELKRANGFESDSDSVKPRAVRNPLEFFELSERSGITLRGFAGANLNNTAELVFFESSKDLKLSDATEIPLRRIQSMQLLSEVPMENTPMDLASLWQVEILLKPTGEARKEELFTVFETED